MATNNPSLNGIYTSLGKPINVNSNNRFTSNSQANFNPKRLANSFSSFGNSSTVPPWYDKIYNPFSDNAVDLVGFRGRLSRDNDTSFGGVSDNNNPPRPNSTPSDLGFANDNTLSYNANSAETSRIAGHFISGYTRAIMPNNPNF